MKTLTQVVTMAVAAAMLFPATMFAMGPRTVTYMSDGHPVHGLLYEPAGKGVHPAIVVVHEWWGLDGWIKEQAQQLANEGYVALAVDLYGGKVTTNPAVARQLDMGLNPKEATANVVAAAKYLAAQKNVNAKRIGAVGWCMGGGYAALLAVHDPNLRAVAINYGELPTSRAELARIHAAVLGIFGGVDPVVTPEEVSTFEKMMRSLHKPIEVKTYADAGHAFENQNNQRGYRAADARDAQARMRAFFARELKQQ
jgi:carboxymethylenebutenolidase